MGTGVGAGVADGETVGWRVGVIDGVALGEGVNVIGDAVAAGVGEGGTGVVVGHAIAPANVVHTLHRSSERFIVQMPSFTLTSIAKSLLPDPQYPTTCSLLPVGVSGTIAFGFNLRQVGSDEFVHSLGECLRKQGKRRRLSSK